MRMTYNNQMNTIHLSSNIQANVCAVSGLEYQSNGTERIKGSYPHLIIKADDIVKHLNNKVVSFLAENSDKPVSRLCIRYFVTETGILSIRQLIDNLRLGESKMKVEAMVPLGK